MSEVYVAFTSKAEWDLWRSENLASFSGVRQSVLSAVDSAGYEEPITGTRRKPFELHINPNNFRESISCDELNARKRALLLTLQIELKARGLLNRRNLRILAPEALSKPARILSGRYPYFHGTEYLPTAESKGKHFPIPHMDLQSIEMPDEAFDVFFSGDVMEHLPNPEVAWSEIRRILKQNGVIVSSFPFDPNRDRTLVRARIEANGQLVHVEPPEYHGNPVGAGAGSLVFTVPGWDVLDTLRENGFADAAMVLVASSKHGITANGPPGVFVLVATKDLETRRTRPKVFAPKGLPEKLCGLMALPRSGTTLLTSMFQVHSRFETIYEPWNSKLLSGSADANLQTLTQKAGIQTPTGSYLFVKETSADPSYITFLRTLFEQSILPMDKHLLLLVRRPAHTFLSEVERRSQWWGDDVAVNEKQFSLWCQKSAHAMSAMIRLLIAQDGQVLSYEKLAQDPRSTLSHLAHHIGFEIEPNQLEYEKHLDKSKVRGDVNVANTPAEISNASTERRKLDEHCVDQLLETSDHADWFRALNELHEKINITGLMKIREVGSDLTERIIKFSRNRC